MRKPGIKVYKRRQKVRDLLLKGYAVADIANTLNISPQLVNHDIQEINKRYRKAVEKNPRLLDRQAQLILKHLDGLQKVKKELWTIVEKSKSDNDKIKALRAVVEEMSQEARILRLVDVTKTVNNYIHIEKVELVVNKVIDIIKEFVPIEKQDVALERLKKVGKEILIDKGEE